MRGRPWWHVRCAPCDACPDLVPSSSLPQLECSYFDIATPLSNEFYLGRPDSYVSLAMLVVLAVVVWGDVALTWACDLRQVRHGDHTAALPHRTGRGTV